MGFSFRPSAPVGPADLVLRLVGTRAPALRALSRLRPNSAPSRWRVPRLPPLNRVLEPCPDPGDDGLMSDPPPLSGPEFLARKEWLAGEARSLSHLSHEDQLKRAFLAGWDARTKNLRTLPPVAP